VSGSGVSISNVPFRGFGKTFKAPNSVNVPAIPVDDSAMVYITVYPIVCEPYIGQALSVYFTKEGINAISNTCVFQQMYTMDEVYCINCSKGGTSRRPKYDTVWYLPHQNRKDEFGAE